jgi:predicted TIM-barrel fold metal-dependent hydrolase
MIIDSHYHLDERMLNIDDLILRMDATGVDRIACIATLNDPLPEPSPALVKIAHFINNHSYMRVLGKMLTDNFTADGSIKLPMGTYHVYPDPDNVPVFAAAKRYPQKFLAWVFVNPRSPKDPLKEIDTWKELPGFIGVKAHPFWHRYPPVELIPVAQYAAKLKKPLLIHAGFNINGNFMPLVNEVQGLNLILAHAGFPAYADTWKTIRARKNIFVDLSQTTFVGEKMTRDVVEYLGAELCLYGTDGPYGPLADDGMYDYGLIKRRIERLFPDEKARRLILGENFARIAGM